jgi:hypothetical protein
VGLAAFVVFVVPWMAFAVWLAPARDQRQAGETQSMASAGAHDGKHQPIASI